MKIGNNIDLQQFQIKNARLHPADAAPSNPAIGQIWTDTLATPHPKLKYWNGVAWVTSDNIILDIEGTAPVIVTNDDGEITISVFADSSDVDNALVLRDNNGNFAANVITADLIGNASTSTKLATSRLISISGKVTANGILFDGSAAVPLNVTAVNLIKSDLVAALQFRLDEFAVPTSNINLNGQKIINLATPTADTDAVNKAYVLSLLAGNKGKYTARVASTGEITIASPGDTIDGVTLSVDDKVLVKDNSANSQNGVYLWKGSAVPMVRATEADTWDEVQGWIVEVLEGSTLANTFWMNVSAVSGTLNTTAVIYVNIGGAAIDVTIENALSDSTNIAGVFKEKDGSTYTLKNIETTNTVGTALSVSGGTNKVTIDFAPENVDLEEFGGVLPVEKGGTGADNAAEARENIGAIGKYTETIGDGLASDIEVTHNLGSEDVSVIVRFANNNEVYHVGWSVVTENKIEINFGSTTIRPVPALNEFKVVVIG